MIGKTPFPPPVSIPAVGFNQGVLLKLTLCVRKGETNKWRQTWPHSQASPRILSLSVQKSRIGPGISSHMSDVGIERMVYVYKGLQLSPLAVYYTYHWTWFHTLKHHAKCMHVSVLLTCSWGGLGPGFMLLAKEYTIGMCLSRLQHRHSLDFEWKWRPGYLSEQVGHVSVSNVAMFGSNFRILAWMERCWNSGSCGCTDCCSLYLVL